MAQIVKPAVDIGIVVSNVEGQRHFYGEVLGLPYLGMMPVPNGVLHVYACGDSYLKLYAMRDTPAAESAAFGTRPGFAYVTFTVAGVEETFAAARAGGATVIAEPGFFDGGVTLAPPIGRMRARFALLADADGNMIELIEYVPGEVRDDAAGVSAEVA